MEKEKLDKEKNKWIKEYIFINFFFLRLLRIYIYIYV
jgi:hypothetical protein